MNAIVYIEPRGANPDGFAVVKILYDHGNATLCDLDVEFSKLAIFGRHEPRALDFLLLAAAVYALDKLVLRRDANDAWTRKLSITLPVSDPAAWNRARTDLAECLSFLSGDQWTVQFTKRENQLVRRVKRRRRRQRTPKLRGDVVCLFSGGLDSLIGAVDRLEERTSEKVVLVGHHDAQMTGPLSDQNALMTHLGPVYGSRVSSVFVRVGHSEAGREITLRSRSLLFVALGILAASSMGPHVPLLIPENGTIALNVPLTPSRRGSCSTRTVHPHYLRSLSAVLQKLGINNPVINPLDGKTKGEAVAQCRNPSLLKQMVPVSVSCAKRGHKVHFTHRDANGCGRCMPCIYRRAALYTIGLDNEVYGDDFCTGEVDLRNNNESGPNDLRACFSFLNRNPSIRELESMLLSSGSLDASRISEYADLVQRAMNEIRRLIRDKAVPHIREAAGIV